MVTFVAAACLARADLFSPEEVQRVLDYWKPDYRLSVAPVIDTETLGPWTAVYNPEASTWLLTYLKARQGTGGKVIPTQDPAGKTPEQKAADAWIDAKVNHDEGMAKHKAVDMNFPAARGGAPRLPMPPADPGACPREMVALAGYEPPPFYLTMRRSLFTVQFDDIIIRYNDNVKVRRKYAYYRFPEGVASEGVAIKEMPVAELDGLFNDAGLSKSDRRVMGAVSLLEGGFDAVNTYDTGYVSVGFIQFATLKEGAGSLGKMMLGYKATDPENFRKDFHAYGIDVDSDGSLVVLDYATGALRRGPDANMACIRDKRLVAVFQRAGVLSKPFRLAQLRSAKEQFYPGDDPVTVTFSDGHTEQAKVKDFVKSEAGMATLFDKKVNTGHIRELAGVLSAVAATHSCAGCKGLAKYEREIVQKMRYRRDFLADPTLGQPLATSL